MRRGSRVGDYLAVDDESGFVRYRSQLKKRWDGALVGREGWETRHPQEFVKAKADPYPVPDTRAEPLVLAAANVIPEYVGNTPVLTQTHNAAAHLFELESDQGIGVMTIGSTFRVR